MSKKKILDNDTRGRTVEVERVLYDSIKKIFKSSTGVKPVMKDFVAQAITEKLSQYK